MTQCKAVMKMTVWNGFSLQTLISQYLICCQWQFQMGFRSSEGTPHLKTWPYSANHFEWTLTGDIDQPILDLLSLTVSHSLSEDAPRLKIWTHFGFDSCFTDVFSTKDQRRSGEAEIKRGPTEASLKMIPIHRTGNI